MTDILSWFFGSWSSFAILSILVLGYIILNQWDNSKKDKDDIKNLKERIDNLEKKKRKRKVN